VRYWYLFSVCLEKWEILSGVTGRKWRDSVFEKKKLHFLVELWKLFFIELGGAFDYRLVCWYLSHSNSSPPTSQIPFFHHLVEILTRISCFFLYPSEEDMIESVLFEVARRRVGLDDVESRIEIFDTFDAWINEVIRIVSENERVTHRLDWLWEFMSFVFCVRLAGFPACTSEIGIVLLDFSPVAIPWFHFESVESVFFFDSLEEYFLVVTSFRVLCEYCSCFVGKGIRIVFYPPSLYPFLLELCERIGQLAMSGSRCWSEDFCKSWFTPGEDFEEICDPHSEVGL